MTEYNNTAWHKWKRTIENKERLADRPKLIWFLLGDLAFLIIGVFIATIPTVIWHSVEDGTLIVSKPVGMWGGGISFLTLFFFVNGIVNYCNWGKPVGLWD